MTQHETDPVVARVLRYANEWGEIQQDRDETIAQYADSNPPPSALITLYLHLFNGKRDCAQRLQERWGLAVLPEFACFVSGEQRPQNEMEWDAFLGEIALFMALTQICETFPSFHTFPASEQWRAAIGLWGDMPKISLVCYAMLAQRLQSIGKGEGSLLVLAGWAKKHLGLFASVAQLLSPNMARSQAFSAELPAAVSLAMAQWTTPEDGVAPQKAVQHLLTAISQQLPRVQDPPSSNVLRKLAVQEEVDRVDPEEVVLRQEALRLIDAPGVLTARERQVAQLYYRDERKLWEVAAELGVAQGTVESMTSRIKGKLVRAFAG